MIKPNMKQMKMSLKSNEKNLCEKETSQLEESEKCGEQTSHQEEIPYLLLVKISIFQGMKMVKPL